MTIFLKEEIFLIYVRLVQEQSLDYAMFDHIKLVKGRLGTVLYYVPWLGHMKLDKVRLCNVKRSDYDRLDLVLKM